MYAQFRNSNRAAHSGHNGQSGVQNHSVGDHYPVLSYRIGDRALVAQFQGIQRESDCNDWSDHTDQLDLLKAAECITDAIFADRDGGSVFLDRPDCPDHGYCVSIPDHESKFGCIDGEYGSVYADVVGKLEWIKLLGFGGRPIAIGWWGRDGQLYLDISVVIFDRAEALAYAESSGQIAIYDLAAQSDIDIRYA